MAYNHLGIHIVVFITAIGINSSIVCMKRAREENSLEYIMHTKEEPAETITPHNSANFHNIQWWYVDHIHHELHRETLDVYFTHQEELLACAFNPSKVIIFDNATHKPIHEFSDDRRTLAAVDIHSIKKIAALYKSDKIGYNLEIRHNKPTEIIIRHPYLAMPSSTSPIKWSPSGKLIALKDNVRTSFGVYTRPYINKKIKTNDYTAIFHPYEASIINKFVFSPNNQNVATATANQVISVANLQQQTGIFRSRSKEIATALVFSNDSTQLSCAFRDGLIQTFNLNDKSFLVSTEPSPIFEYKNSSTIWKLFYNEKNELMGWYLTKDETCIEMINTVTGEKTPIFYTHQLPSCITCIEFNSTQDRFAIGLKNGTLLSLKKNNNPTPIQIVLRILLHRWIQSAKPSKGIINPYMLLKAVETTFGFTEDKLNILWSTIPDYIQTAIWNNMKRLIEKYGK